MEDLRSIRGIGPFYSSLIVVRASGFTDVLSTNEPKGLELTGRLYSLAARRPRRDSRRSPRLGGPFRTWCVVLIRAAGLRVLGRG